MATNQIEEKMDSYLNDLKSVEETLNNQLEQLSESVDESFGAMSDMVREITNLTVQSTNGLVSGATRSKIGLAGSLIERTLYSAGNIYKAIKHNQALDKLLKVKKEIAKAKADELKRIRPIVVRVHENLKKGLINEGSKRYPLKEMDSEEKWNLLLDRMDKYLDMYRTSVYLGLVIDYLQAEYKAWLNGKQTSTVMRPDYYAANQQVVKLLEEASHEKAVDTYLDVFEGSPEELSGSTIYYLMDSQLSGTILSMVEDTYVLEDPKNKYLNKVMDGNLALLHYRANGYQLMGEKLEGPKKCHYSFKYTIAFAFIYCYVGRNTGIAEWTFPVAIILALIVGYFGRKKNKTLEEIYPYNLYLRSLYMKEEAKKYAGYVEFPEVDLEKKSIIKSALMG